LVYNSEHVVTGVLLRVIYWRETSLGLLCSYDQFTNKIWTSF